MCPHFNFDYTLVCPLIDIQPTSILPTGAQVIAGKIPLYLSSIRIWEALIATPFAYIGMVLAPDGWPGWHLFIWLTVALMGVRTLGMSANRLIPIPEGRVVVEPVYRLLFEKHARLTWWRNQSSPHSRYR